MSSNVNFNLSNMPPAGWIALISVLAMVTGKLFQLDFLFWLGVILFVFDIIAIIVSVVIDLAR
ncbi:MAG: hypothetical protein QXZ43_03180 [Candidatus Aenigmatarchaeota archaeon]